MPDPRIIRNWQRKEGLALPDELVAKLPHLPRHHPHRQQAILDGYALERVAARLRILPYRLSILVVGSGNGWVCHYLSKLEKTTVLGIDFIPENHEQARRVFGGEGNPEFQLAEIFQDAINPASFDLVLLHGIAQFYPDVGKLMGQALEYLNPKGELHLLGSPFHEIADIERERKAQWARFEEMRIPEMKEHCHFHSVEEMTALGAHLLYNPYSPSGGLKGRVLRGKDSDQPWWMLPGGQGI